MLTFILAQVDPKTVDMAATHLEKTPWLGVVLPLLGIVAVLLLGVVFFFTKFFPWLKEEIKAWRELRTQEQQAQLAHTKEMMAARGAESEKTVQHVIDTGRHNLDLMTKEVGERVADLKDGLASLHETTRQVQRQLAGVAAKTGTPIVLLALIWFIPYHRMAGASHTSVAVARRAAPAASAPVELARVNTGEPGTTPPPGRKLPPPGPVRKDCDSTTCKPPSYCSRGVCQGAARKPPPAKLAGGRMLGPSSFAVRASWQDIEPEAFPEPLSDSRWLAGVLP